ncbi:TIGR00289 family protein [Candidatus Bathyarchaeota archaeon]|nr:TIGR00289 family protein [Candidatus Bathyarchaeota archaeon]
MKVAALISGGKDSALALHQALKRGYNVKYLVTLIPQREDSWMFHYPNVELTDLFAEACGIPLVKAETSGVKEEELEDLRSLLDKLDIEGVVSGAIASTYQKSRIGRICVELGLKSITPLWHKNEKTLIETLISEGFSVIFTGVYAYGLDEKWLGRKLDQRALRDLIMLSKRYGISLMGEGGEYETLVLDAPYFRKRIKILRARTIWKGESGYLLVEDACLEDKG